MSRLFTIFWCSIPLLIFSIVLVCFGQGLQKDSSYIPSPLIGKPMPSFSNPSLNNPRASITRKQLLGRIYVLNVWSSWCIYCQAEHRVLMSIAKSQPVLFYGLNYKDQRAAAKRWLHMEGNPYRDNIYDPEGKLALNLGVYGTPEKFLIDQNGIIRYKYIGPITQAVWQKEFLPRIQQLATEKEARK